MSWYYGPDEAYAVQRLAREQMVQKLLVDLLVDMRICQLEGWNVMEYPERLKEEIDAIYQDRG